jgi:lysozyme family protein
MADFLDALRVVLIHEGGKVDNANDPGGITDRGISLRFLKDHGIDIDGDGDVDAEDIRHLNDEDVERLYSTFFWAAVHGDSFQQVVASKLFDAAVNMGPGQAIKLAQRAVGADVDGFLGPKTWRAINDSSPRLFLANFVLQQNAFYSAVVKARPAAVEFLDGWTVRANCTAYAPCKTCLWRGRKPL